MVEHQFAALPPVGSDVTCDGFGGVQCQALALVGREDRVAAATKLGDRERMDAPCRPLLHGGVAVDPLGEIARRAHDAQIVIINEAHDAPDDRAFIADVATALRPIGFTLFAAESFEWAIGRDGPAYPRASDGYYVNEPAFGELVRRGRTLGFAFVPYEQELPPTLASAGPPPPPPTPAEMSARINDREEAQAANLVARIFAADAHARVLIHVGYGHLSELPGTGFGDVEIRMMGLRLKEKTGIDPLTVDQAPYFGRAGDRRVVCAATADGSALSGSDITIMPPLLAFERGRPTWRLALGQHAVEVPRAMLRPNERVIVEARRAGEPSDAVPVDRLLLDPGESLPLLLKPGEYVVRACPQAGACSAEARLTAR